MVDSPVFEFALDPGLCSTLKNLRPELHEQEFVYLSLSREALDATGPWEALAQVREAEGITLVVSRDEARSRGFDDAPVFRCITFGVDSALEEVGLTAAVSSVLAGHGIAANFLAAYHHDHVLVPAERGPEALERLRELAANPSCYALAPGVAGNRNRSRP